jgi:hypothetical protein
MPHWLGVGKQEYDDVYDFNTGEWKQLDYPVFVGPDSSSFGVYYMQKERYEALARTHGTSQAAKREEVNRMNRANSEEGFRTEISKFAFDELFTAVKDIGTRLSKLSNSREDAFKRQLLAQILDIHVAELHSLAQTFVRWVHSTPDFKEEHFAILKEYFLEWRKRLSRTASITTIARAYGYDGVAVAADVCLDIESVIAQKQAELRRMALLERIAETLEAIRDELRQANMTLRLQTRMLGNIAHEMRASQELQYHNLMGMYALGRSISSMRTDITLHAGGGLFSSGSTVHASIGPRVSFENAYAQIVNDPRQMMLPH